MGTRQFVGAVAGPEFVAGWGRWCRNGTSTRLASLAALPDAVQQLGEDFFSGRRVERQRELAEDVIFPDEAVALLHEVDAVGFEIVESALPVGQR